MTCCVRWASERKGEPTKVIAHQRDVSRLERDVRASSAHCYSDGRLRERRGVVHSVADHRYRTPRREVADLGQLVFRLHRAAKALDAEGRGHTLDGDFLIAREHDEVHATGAKQTNRFRSLPTHAILH